jgi:Zn-dependent protease with chaperone function
LGALLVATLVIMQLLRLGFNLTIARIAIPYIVIDLRQFALYGSPWPPTLLLLGIMLAAASWLLPLLLRRCYGMTPYHLSDLETYSPEAVRLLRQAFTGRQRWNQLPTLGLLPTDAPIVFTVGVAPTVATLALSRGALAQFTADELATLVAAEIAHLARWDAAPLSVLMAIAQLGYLGYWQLALGSDRLSNRIVQTLLNGLSSLCYGLFWLMRLIGVGLSRLRLNYSDRLALDLTGNPNGMSRALLKTTAGLAETCAHQGQIPPLLASFDLLLPVSLEQAITSGSLTPQPPEATLLERDRLHSFGRWLWIRSSHLPLAVRLHRLAQVAHYWQLTPAYTLGSTTAKPPTPTRAESRTFLLQAAPFAGAAAGLAFGSMLGLFGAIALRLGWLQFDWLQQSSVFLGCGLIGFSIGTFLRINSFFPDITRNNLHSDEQLKAWLSEPNTLPIHSIPVKLEGTLLGRPGHQTVLGQDLLLHLTNGALIKLHYVSRWGWLDALWPRTPHPRAWLQQSVTVVGWLRRGSTPWLDVDQLYPKAGKRLVAGHPLWSTAIAGLTTLLGCWLFLTTR